MIPEMTGSPIGVEEKFPHETLSPSTIEILYNQEDIFISKRGNEDEDQGENIIKAFFASLPNGMDKDFTYTEYLHAVHDINTSKKREEHAQDTLETRNSHMTLPFYCMSIIWEGHMGIALIWEGHMGLTIK